MGSLPIFSCAIPGGRAPSGAAISFSPNRLADGGGLGPGRAPARAAAPLGGRTARRRIWGLRLATEPAPNRTAQHGISAAVNHCRHPFARARERAAAGRVQLGTAQRLGGGRRRARGRGHRQQPPGSRDRTNLSAVWARSRFSVARFRVGGRRAARRFLFRQIGWPTAVASAPAELPLEPPHRSAAAPLGAGFGVCASPPSRRPTALLNTGFRPPLTTVVTHSRARESGRPPAQDVLERLGGGRRRARGRGHRQQPPGSRDRTNLSAVWARSRFSVARFRVGGRRAARRFLFRQIGWPTAVASAPAELPLEPPHRSAAAPLGAGFWGLRLATEPAPNRTAQHGISAAVNHCRHPFARAQSGRPLLGGGRRRARGRGHRQQPPGSRDRTNLSAVWARSRFSVARFRVGGRRAARRFLFRQIGWPTAVASAPAELPLEPPHRSAAAPLGAGSGVCASPPSRRPTALLNTGFRPPLTTVVTHSRARDERAAASWRRPAPRSR